MNEIAVILVAGSQKQNECFWPSYANCAPRAPFDLIVVHRNGQHLPMMSSKLPDICNNTGRVILENKIFPDGELAHRAFGAYRHFSRKYLDKYKFFVFISDDVVLKCDGWLLKTIEPLTKYNELGWTASQIFNMGQGEPYKYPHPSHARAPYWAAKSDAIREIKWEFNSDHDGEMSIADQFLKSKYFGIQVGNKVNIAYDSLENGGYFVGDHISSIFEKNILNNNLLDKFSCERDKENNEWLIGKLESSQDDLEIKSPHFHIGARKIVSQLEPFDNLIYEPSLELAKKYSKNYPFNINILK